MKSSLNRAFAVVFLFLSVAHAAEKPSCAILTLDALTGVAKGQAVLLSDRLAAEIGRTEKYTIIARQKMKEILAIQAEGMSDVCSATDCAVELGRIISVQYIVCGSLGRLGSLYTVNTSLVDVETAKVLRSATTDHRGGVESFLTEAIRKNAEQLLGMARKTAPEPEPTPIIPAMPPSDSQTHKTVPQQQERDASTERDDKRETKKPPRIRIKSH